MTRIEKIEADYKELMALKKTNPGIVNRISLLNQQILIACGRVHSMILAIEDKNVSDKQYACFIENTLPGMYYVNWRKDRAISLALCLGTYERLNVNLKLCDVKGETWYAGIPVTTQEEIDAASIFLAQESMSWIAVDEKIGIDGRYHPCDANGEFCPLENSNDVYGDGTMVTVSDISAALEDR